MLDYDTLTVCGKSLHQPEYRIMKRAFEKGLSKKQVNAIFENQDLLDPRKYRWNLNEYWVYHNDNEDNLSPN